MAVLGKACPCPNEISRGTFVVWISLPNRDRDERPRWSWKRRTVDYSVVHEPKAVDCGPCVVNVARGTRATHTHKMHGDGDTDGSVANQSAARSQCRLFNIVRLSCEVLTQKRKDLPTPRWRRADTSATSLVPSACLSLEKEKEKEKVEEDAEVKETSARQFQTHAPPQTTTTTTPLPYTTQKARDIFHERSAHVQTRHTSSKQESFRSEFAGRAVLCVYADARHSMKLNHSRMDRQTCDRATHRKSSG